MFVDFLSVAVLIRISSIKKSHHPWPDTGCGWCDLYLWYFFYHYIGSFKLIRFWNYPKEEKLTVRKVSNNFNAVL